MVSCCFSPVKCVWLMILNFTRKPRKSTGLCGRLRLSLASRCGLGGLPFSGPPCPQPPQAGGIWDLPYRWVPPPVSQRHCSAPFLGRPRSRELPALGNSAICCLFVGISHILVDLTQSCLFQVIKSSQS